jgi:hypothetical protein
MDVTLVVVGVVLCVIGLAMLGKSQNGGLNLRNLGINLGGTSTQKIRVSNIREDDKKGTLTWVGLATAAIGFLAAAIELFKVLRRP